MKYEFFGALGILLALVATSCSDDSSDGGGTGGGGGATSGTGGSKATGGAATGGGGSGSGGSSSGACMIQNTMRPSTSAEDACCLLCVAEDHCNAETTLDNCAGPNGYRKCGELTGQAPACDMAVQKYFDCLRMVADVCEPGAACDAVAEMVQTVCM